MPISTEPSNDSLPTWAIDAAKRTWDALSPEERSILRFRSFEDVQRMFGNAASNPPGGVADPNVIPALDANAHLMMFRELNRMLQILENQNTQFRALLTNVLGAHANAIPR